MQADMGNEGGEIECRKEVPSDSRQYTKTAAAFANGAGGVIIFGIEPGTGTVAGLDPGTVLKSADAIANAICDSVEPVPDFTIQFKERSGKQLVVLRVSAGSRRPYFLKSEGKEDGTYFRVAGTTRHADAPIVKELELQGSRIGFDSLPVPGAAVARAQAEALCRTMYRYAVDHAGSEEERKLIRAAGEKNLVSWGLLIRRAGKLIPTNGFSLLTGDGPGDSAIQCAVFKGRTRSLFLDKREYSGPLQEQIDEAYAFVLRNLRVGMSIRGTTSGERYEMPPEGVRELISNAVVYRSFVVPGKVQVFLYDDRLEVTSPGMLIGGATIEDLKRGCSTLRNKAIANAFQYMRIIEAFGSGIPRLFEECRRYGLRDPQLSEIGQNFRVEIFRKGEPGGMSRETPESRILSMFREDPLLTRKKLAATLGLTEAKVGYWIRKLRADGVLLHEGARASGKWVVKPRSGDGDS